MIDAPFTPEQVEALNKYQASGFLHPFTCMGHEGCTRPEEYNDGLLIAKAEGWVCPCGKYTQHWAHDFMTEPPVNPLDQFPQFKGKV